MRLIDADALKQAADKAFEHIDSPLLNHITTYEVYSLIDNAPTIEVGFIGEWIPVSERLPEDMKSVLIWFEYHRYGDYNCIFSTYGFCYVLDGKWSPFINGETGWRDARIIAWMPLPEPYKEEKNET